MKAPGKWALVLVAIGGLYAWLSGRPARVEMDLVVVEPALSAQAQRGKAVFGEICAACHGADLTGTDNGPPLIHITYRPAMHADFAISSAIKNGVTRHHWRFGNMPPQPGVKDEEIGGIIAYIREMQRANGVE